MARPKGNSAFTETRKDAILDAALEVFGSNGFHGSSLKQVADLVGITEAGILHHFGNKGGLLRAVLNRRDDISQAFFPEDIDGMDWIVGWVKLIKHNMANPGIVELYTVLSGESTTDGHPAHAYFVQRYNMVRELQERYFQLSADAGLLREGLIPSHVGETLIALADGCQVQWLLDRNFDMLGRQLGFFENILTPAAWQELQRRLAAA